MFDLEHKIYFAVQSIQNLNPCVQSTKLSISEDFPDFGMRLPKGEDEFKLNFPCTGFECEVQ